ncbi:MAG: hypothetical protein E7I57_09715 [Anaerococcus vaginalis]|uniref:hypothetical protein n=1 Tax=Bacillota TaxID=1239 RepID=UPI0018A8FE11|nr:MULTISPECIES: hypothetical protein [Bacillota]MDU4321087.1 hypothetical protein [Clostridium sp.]MDU4379685.1 hypothetical protein [Anaerococcus vaginalis]MEE0727593.1 hypothetical protein [Clostridium saudiense]
MATNGVKGEVIRARLDEDLKIRLKKMCKDKKISMSKFIINMIEDEVNKYEFKMKNKKIIDSRAEGTEKKLQKLREKLKVPK